jgi:hypothetical protein
MKVAAGRLIRPIAGLNAYLSNLNRQHFAQHVYSRNARADRIHCDWQSALIRVSSRLGA